MYLIKNGYEFFKFFSISYVVKEHKKNYYNSILKCEDEYRDLTRFIDFNIEMMCKAVEGTLEKYNNEYLKSELEKYMNKYKIYLTLTQSVTLKKYLKRNDKQLTVTKYSKETFYIINILEDFIRFNNKEWR